MGDDAWNFGSLDAYVGNLAAAGIRPFPVFFHTASFVSSDDRRLPVHSAQAKEQWREFVARVVQRYRAGGEYWSTAYPIQHPGATRRAFDAVARDGSVATWVDTLTSAGANSARSRASSNSPSWYWSDAGPTSFPANCSGLAQPGE